MKKILPFVLALLVCAVPVIGCGSEPVNVPTREAQLAVTGIFETHSLCGIATTESLDGNFGGGFFILLGGASGQISSETIVSLKVQNQNSSQYFVEVPRSLISMKQSGNTTYPTVVFVFNQEWLNGQSNRWETGPGEISIDVNQHVVKSFAEIDYYYTYTEGAISNPTNFIMPQNLAIVEITYPLDTNSISSNCWGN